LCRKLAPQLGGPELLTFYQQPERHNYNWCYINNNKNFVINCVEQLLVNKPATMFVNHNLFIIHPVNQKCKTELPQLETKTVPFQQQITDFIQLYYPKQKFMNFVFNILTKHKLLNEDLLFIDFPDIHVADFCSQINNPFNKSKKKNNSKLYKLFKHLRQKKIKFPVVCIKNPSAQTFLC
jgi:hypothetical protein